MAKNENQSCIWLEVIEVQFDTKKKKKLCRVSLKADRGQTKPVWWPVKDSAVAKGKNAAFDTYKAVLSEMDKKRTVLARLSHAKKGSLRCDALRFQSPELGSR